ncbi:MAG: hypothetical protein K0R39_2199 [Symbiobacteriaceae bacterium]|nr:hypothetical protein [Symbiobacteriaceae bacterium]
MEQDGLAYMAACFAEEFAHMGYSEEALLAVFRDPFYQGPHLAYKLRGEDWVRALIRRVIA